MGRTALLGLAVALAVAGAAWVEAGSNGYAAEEAAVSGGCTCHSPDPNAGTQLTLTGVPKTYRPGTAYPLVLTSQTDVIPNPTRNIGGFLAVATAGTLVPTAGEAAWYRHGNFSDGRFFVGHNLQGAEKNTFQEWRFTWTAPDPGIGAVTLQVYVNRVNGDALATLDDHWNEKTVTIPGPGTPPSPAPSTTKAPATTSPPPPSPSSTPSSPSPTPAPATTPPAPTPPPETTIPAAPPEALPSPTPDDHAAPAPWTGPALLALLAAAGLRRSR